jgi:hypothetical protein
MVSINAHYYCSGLLIYGYDWSWVLCNVPVPDFSYHYRITDASAEFTPYCYASINRE